MSKPDKTTLKACPLCGGIADENWNARAESAAIAAAREALEYTLKRLNGAGAEWFDDPHFGEPLTEKVIRTLALLTGRQP